MVGISNVTNKARFGKEGKFGDESPNFDFNFGLINSVSYSENDNPVKILDVTSKHYASKFEAGIYSVSGTIETKPTKISMSNIFESFGGKKTVGTETKIEGNVVLTNDILEEIGDRKDNPFEFTVNSETVSLGIDFTNMTITNFLYLVQGQLNNNTIEISNGVVLIRRNELGEFNADLSGDDGDIIFGNPTLVDGTDDPIKYKIITDPKILNSYSMIAEYVPGKLAKITGIVIKDISVDFQLNSPVVIKMNYIAKSLDLTNGDINNLSFPDTTFFSFDCYSTLSDKDIYVNSFSLNSNWNISDEEGRALEKVKYDERRKIKRVIKHLLDVTGNLDIEVDEDFNIGYRNDIVTYKNDFIMNRGSGNEHKFTINNFVISNKDMTINKENTKRNITSSYMAQNFSVIGDY